MSEYLEIPSFVSNVRGLPVDPSALGFRRSRSRAAPGWKEMNKFDDMMMFLKRALRRKARESQSNASRPKDFLLRRSGCDQRMRCQKPRSLTNLERQREIEVRLFDSGPAKVVTKQRRLLAEQPTQVSTFNLLQGHFHFTRSTSEQADLLWNGFSTK